MGLVVMTVCYDRTDVHGHKFGAWPRKWLQRRSVPIRFIACIGVDLQNAPRGCTEEDRKVNDWLSTVRITSEILEISIRTTTLQIIR
jgi:hypothetical protein